MLHTKSSLRFGTKKYIYNYIYILDHVLTILTVPIFLVVPGTATFIPPVHLLMASVGGSTQPAASNKPKPEGKALPSTSAGISKVPAKILF